ncbi:hypothetical protein [Leptospira levettii]|uniref:hypothetical protein n=1 Tax=Leptospira levettii TaxID=2023178 RepID=UPI0010829B77|nr:hypothetical protein [Leptospira levettii]TGL10278.1 hypothetical protein EHQ39_08575 [Leptospira levettii]
MSIDSRDINSKQIIVDSSYELNNWNNYYYNPFQKMSQEPLYFHSLKKQDSSSNIEEKELIAELNSWDLASDQDFDESEF